MLGHETPAGNCSLRRWCAADRANIAYFGPNVAVGRQRNASKCISQLSTNGACGVLGLAGMIGRAEPAGSGWGRMQIVNGEPVYSATDLVGFLACANLTSLERAALAKLVPIPHYHDRELEVIQRRGFEHEKRYLDELRAGSKEVFVVDTDSMDQPPGERLRREAEATIAAMTRGAAFVYQATFFDGQWVGHADFLHRVESPDRPSMFGEYHYEVADTKLARHVKASALLQICSYVDQLERLQGLRPREMHVILGGNPRRTETFRVDDYFAYYRMARRRFEEAVGENALAAVYPLPMAPDPLEHCDVCRWIVNCNQHRRDSDHLSLVAGISSGQRRRAHQSRRYHAHGPGDLTLPLGPLPVKTSSTAMQRVREQARIQLEGRQRNATLHELLEPVQESGLACLPPPSPGDLFLDLEGDPFAFNTGLEYLFGVLQPAVLDDHGEPTFHYIWSQGESGEFSFEGERAAFQKTIDLIVDRLDTDPNMHVYHYAPYEPAAFKRLMGRYGTREDEVDRLLRGGIFVDLYRVVRQGLRASVESYSIKKLEPLYGLTRTIGLRDAGSSIAEFEEWLQLSDGERPGADHLENIRLYNRDDVLSTWRLRDWLEGRRDSLVVAGTHVPRPMPKDAEPPAELSEILQRTEELAARLTDGVSLDPSKRDAEQHARWLLAQLLSWHRREEKSTWWQYFHLMTELNDEERVEAREPIGGLEFLDRVGEVQRSVLYRYRYPEQDHSIKVDSTVHDPNTMKSCGTVESIDEAKRTIDLKRGKNNTAPHPTSIVPLDHVNSAVMRDSLLRLGEWVAEHGITANGANRAARALLLREPPQLWGQSNEGGQPLQHADESILDAACRIGRTLVQSVLPIQGPPGAGKTFTGAHMIVDLLRMGKKVGITANSHKVIGNLLEAVCLRAAADGVDLCAIQNAPDGAGVDHPNVKGADSKSVGPELASGECDLAAGTAWLWSRPDMECSVDVLFVDEAGQMSLAYVTAVASAAGALVLLGDPQQLDQPLKGIHPPGADASALGHLLGAHATIPSDRGLFLETTWRLHPNVCQFTSEAFYESKLVSESQLCNQAIATGLFDGPGLWLWPVEHEGNDTASEEEALVVAQIARELVESPATWVDQKGVERDIGWADVLIVAPYNAQVGMIQRRLPTEARVGTVDKFQGQEAPVSIYSMATSNPEGAPRGMSFLYSRNRLNVASSRARCAAILVCSPNLLSVCARTPEQMRLANALCQFAELARTPRPAQSLVH